MLEKVLEAEALKFVNVLMLKKERLKFVKETFFQGQ